MFLGGIYGGDGESPPSSYALFTHHREKEFVEGCLHSTKIVDLLRQKVAAALWPRCLL